MERPSRAIVAREGLYGSASIEVVDAAHRLKLPDHVGQKVSVTGTLVDREMQVRSLRRVATSCGNSPKVRV